ncbi:hypothetical protein Tco_0536061 [Tanacetum coccineum]
MLELILHQQRTPQLLKQKKLIQTQKDHSHPIPALNVDSLKVDFVVIQNTCSEKEDNDLKGTRIEHGFKRAFMSLFGQDVDTFTSTMLLNVDQLQKQLDKDEFQEDGSMAAFWVVNNQFQKFIDSKDTFQHLGNVKKSVAERTRHQRQYERRVNKRQMQTQESKIDTGKALDADLVDTESIRTDSTVQDDRNRWDLQESYFDSCTSKIDSKPPHGSNVDIPHIHECKQTLDSMVAEKDDISETIVKVDSQMMIQKNDVCSQQFRPRSSMSNDVCSQQFRPRSSMSNDVCS